MSSNLFDINCTQENVQLHIQHGERRLRGIIIGKLQVTRLYFLKEIVRAHFQRLFGRSNHDVFLKTEDKIHEGRCLKVFLVILQVSISQLHYRLTYLQIIFRGF